MYECHKTLGSRFIDSWFSWYTGMTSQILTPILAALVFRDLKDPQIASQPVILSRTPKSTCLFDRNCRTAGGTNVPRAVRALISH